MCPPISAFREAFGDVVLGAIATGCAVPLMGADDAPLEMEVAGDPMEVALVGGGIELGIGP